MPAIVSVLEGVELRKKTEEAAINRRSASKSQNLKLNLAQAGIFEAPETDQSRLEQSATQERLKLKEAELAETRKLRQQGVLSAKEAADKILSIEQGLTQEKGKAD
jgi:hypothetical protein